KFAQVWKRIKDFTPMGSKEEAERAKSKEKRDNLREGASEETKIIRGSS
nr:hypothetical protein [Tanacetum cinerariifolium]